MVVKEKEIMAGPLLSLRQVSQTLGVSERTVYRLMEDGELHPFKMGKSWKFDQNDVERYLDQLRKTATKERKEALVTQIPMSRHQEIVLHIAQAYREKNQAEMERWAQELAEELEADLKRFLAAEADRATKTSA